MDIGKMIGEALTEAKKEMEKDRKVLKSVPMKPEWKKLHAELDALAVKRAAMEKEFESKRKFMWATIEKDLGIYDKDLHINSEKNKLEVYES